MRDNSYYIGGIKENKFAVLQDIYKDFSTQIESMVLKNSGNSEDAEDIFQEGLLVIFKKLQNDELELTSSFGTYLYAVCRFIWLKKLNKKRKSQVTLTEIPELTDDTKLDEQLVEVQKRSVFEKHFQALSEECRKVLQMHFNKIKGSEIAERMGYSLDYVKRKKYKCKNNLIEKIKSDHLYKELSEY